MEGTHGRVEGRIGPGCRQFSTADAVRLVPLGNVDSVSNHRQLAGRRIGLALAAPHNVVDLFVLRAFGIDPAFGGVARGRECRS
jgi:hypothetical protein